MTTNVTIFPVDGPAIAYLQDGTSKQLVEQQQHSMQIIEGGILTISDPFDDQQTAEQFVEMMIKFWQDMLETIREEAGENQPEINPL